MKKLLSILVVLSVLSCTKEEDVTIDPSQTLVGEWNVFHKVPQPFYPKDTIYQFMENDILLLRRNINTMVAQDSFVRSELWYYTHWWIDEDNLELVYPNPYFGEPAPITFEEYFSEYGGLIRYQISHIEPDKIEIRRDFRDSAGVVVANEIIELNRIN